MSWLCVDAALFRRVFSVYGGIVVPYSAAPMCQLVDALRFGHVGACLPTIWHVPVHLLPYHRGTDPSERSHRAAYCLQQRCLVRLCVVFYQFSITPIREMAPGVPCKALNKIIQLQYGTGMREMAPIGEMAPGCAKKYKKYKKPVRTRCHLTHDYGNPKKTNIFSLCSP